MMRGATIINEGGVGVRDIALHAGRVPALGNLGSVKAAETLDARALHIAWGNKYSGPFSRTRSHS